MALQDVCGFQDTLSNLGCSDDRTPIGEKKAVWTTLFEREGESPLRLLLPPQQSVGQSRGRRSVFPSAVTSTPRPFLLSHGTTTLAFAFQGGVIAAGDTRASCAGLIACPFAQKVTPIHSHLVVTSSGSGADCVLWERVLAREIRLYQLRHGRRLSVGGAGKLLALMLHPFKGTEVCVAATLCGWDGGDEVNKDQIMQDPAKRGDHGTPENTNSRSTLTYDLSTLNAGTLAASHQADRISVEDSENQNLSGLQCAASPQGGPRVCYVCSDGLRLNGELISVGSGSPYAYSVLDDGLRWEMSVDEAVALAREAVYRATHRDAYSGNNVDLFHVTACGWKRRRREDLKEEYYKEKMRGQEMI